MPEPATVRITLRKGHCAAILDALNWNVAKTRWLKERDRNPFHSAMYEERQHQAEDAADIFRELLSKWPYGV